MLAFPQPATNESDNERQDEEGQSTASLSTTWSHQTLIDLSGLGLAGLGYLGKFLHQLRQQLSFGLCTASASVMQSLPPTKKCVTMATFELSLSTFPIKTLLLYISLGCLDTTDRPQKGFSCCEVFIIDIRGKKDSQKSKKHKTLPQGQKKIVHNNAQCRHDLNSQVN